MDMETGISEDLGIEFPDDFGVVNPDHLDLGSPNSMDFGGVPNGNCRIGEFRCAPGRSPQAMDRCDPTGWVALPPSQDCSQFPGLRCHDQMGSNAVCM
jgi:hypothetical protein